MKSDTNETYNTLNVILNMLYYGKMKDMLYFMCCDSATIARCNFYFFSDRDEYAYDSEYV